MPHQTVQHRLLTCAALVGVGLGMSGCLTISGPQVVPDHSTYQYTTDCTGTASWALQSINGKIVGGAATKTVSVHWGEGPDGGELSVKCTDPPKKVETKKHDVAVVKVSFDNSRIAAGTVVDGGTVNKGPQAPYKKGETQGTNAATQPNGVDYKARVRIEPLAGYTEQADKIVVGFVQIVRDIPKWSALYKAPPVRLIAKYESPPSEPNTTAPPPWRDRLIGPSFGKFYHSANFALLKPATDNVLVKEIVSGDKPSTFWPLKNKNQADLARGEARNIYDTYICAITLDAPDVYVVRGKLQWSVDFSVKPVDGTPTVSGTVHIPNPPAFTPVTTGEQPSPLDGLVANIAGNPPRVMFREP